MTVHLTWCGFAACGRRFFNGGVLARAQQRIADRATAFRKRLEPLYLWLHSRWRPNFVRNAEDRQRRAEPETRNVSNGAGKGCTEKLPAWSPSYWLDCDVESRSAR